MKSTPTRGVKQYLKPNAYNQSELDWTLITICDKAAPNFGLEHAMSDGTFAILTFVLGFTDMGLNYCGSEAGCFGRADRSPRLAVSAGEWIDRRATAQSEVYLRYDLGRTLGPFGTSLGLSLAEGGETWVGIGTTYKFEFGQSQFYGELHSMPGLYFDNGGFDLGGAVEFRSGIELGYENDAGWRYGLSYDHRSNAEIYSANPGVETVQFRVSVPLK